jgi:iduronate 2-sulfatase
MMIKYSLSLLFILSLTGLASQKTEVKKPNILFIISDDLSAYALSCYGNKICKTPNIDRLAETSSRFTQAYCQATYCGPSRASFMSGYYPHATGVFGYKSGRKAIGDRATWSEYFKNNGYHTARVSKIFHMPVPKGIELGNDGEDDERSWTERFNSQGPEWKAPGIGETLEGNPEGKRPVMGGNTFVRVEADGDDLVHSDGRTAQKAVELIHTYKKLEKPFFLAVGFVRPHVPFVAPKAYYKDYPWQEMPLPKRLKDDWKDIPKAGINYKTSLNMKMNQEQQKKTISAYYASVSYMDAQVGKVLTALEESDQEANTIVIFTSDHGFHLGEHDFWAKVSLYEESTKVPLIIKVPGKKAARVDSFAELIDLYPTTSSLCGLAKQERLQGKDISIMFDQNKAQVRDAILSANMKGVLIRNKNWAYMEYKDGKGGSQLFNMNKDPQQFYNQINNPEYASALNDLKQRLKKRIINLKTNGL